MCRQDKYRDERALLLYDEMLADDECALCGLPISDTCLCRCPTPGRSVICDGEREHLCCHREDGHEDEDPGEDW